MDKSTEQKSALNWETGNPLDTPSKLMRNTCKKKTAAKIRIALIKLHKVLLFCHHGSYRWYEMRSNSLYIRLTSQVLLGLLTYRNSTTQTSHLSGLSSYLSNFSPSITAVLAHWSSTSWGKCLGLLHGLLNVRLSSSATGLLWFSAAWNWTGSISLPAQTCYLEQPAVFLYQERVGLNY